jgi:hypothetical protein
MGATDSMHGRGGAFRSILAAAALTLGAGGSCGGDGGGLDHRPVRSLSPDELQELCDDLREGPLREITRCALRLICFIGEKLRPECSDARAERCVEDALREVPSEGGACFGEPFDPLRCDVVVGEIKACYAELSAVFFAAAARVSCDGFRVDRAAFSILPPSCRAVNARCPSLFAEE